MQGIEVVAKSIDAAYAAGFRAGAEAMREAAAKAFDDTANADYWGVSKRIRALPLPPK